MVHHLYRRFLVDHRVYRMAQRFWQKLCQRILRAQGKPRDWEKWPDGIVRGGPLDYSGNPMVSLISRTRRKAIVVIQEAPTTDAVQLTTWVDTFPFRGNREDKETIDYLVIACELCDEAGRVAAALMRIWTDDRVSFDAMEAVLEAYERTKGAGMFLTERRRQSHGTGRRRNARRKRPLKRR